jgi:hypothetical protein
MRKMTERVVDGMSSEKRLTRNAICLLEGCSEGKIDSRRNCSSVSSNNIDIEQRFTKINEQDNNFDPSG